VTYNLWLCRAVRVAQQMAGFHGDDKFTDVCVHESARLHTGAKFGFPECTRIRMFEVLFGHSGSVFSSALKSNITSATLKANSECTRDRRFQVHFPSAFQVHFNTALPSALNYSTVTAGCRAFQMRAIKSSWFEEFELYDQDKGEQF
jgi:hypothetical protein